MKVFLFLVTVVPLASLRECNCGYGGICLENELSGEQFSCNKYCKQVSAGYYKNCNEILDYCASSPCKNGGTCIRTFGSYFCQCPKDYLGQRCSIYNATLAKLGISNELYIYHQVQPDKYGMSSFTIIYDAVKLDQQTNADFRLLVEISVVDGRLYYPEKGDQFILSNVKQRCEDESKEDPELNDKRVCNLLPSGDVPAYHVDTSMNGWTKNLNNLTTFIFSPTQTLVALVGFLNITIYVLDLKGKSKLKLFDVHHTTLAYTAGRKQPYGCGIAVKFDGCSVLRDRPTIYARGHPIEVHVSVDKETICPGLLKLEDGWNLQTNVFRCPFTSRTFNEPQPLPKHQNSNVMVFEPLYFKSGVHMLEFFTMYRGITPHYGSPREFIVYNRCWIRTEENTPIFSIKGGNTFTASCLHPVHLEIVQYDPSVDIELYGFTSTCRSNLTGEDPECKLTPLEGNFLRKFITPCESTYTFNITAKHRYNKNRQQITFNVTIVFVPNDLTLTVECLYNCHPIDPSLAVLMYVVTDPYAQKPVVWNVTVEGQIIQERQLFDIFVNSSSTRLLRLSGKQFQQIGDYPKPTPVVQVNVTRPGIEPLKATLLAITDDLLKLARRFKLKPTLFSDSYVYQYPGQISFYFWPVQYTMLFFHPYAQVFTYKLRFPKNRTSPSFNVFPSAQIIQLCLYDAYFIWSCTTPERVEDYNRSQVTVHSLNRTFRAGDYARFRSDCALFLAEHLWDDQADHIRWTIDRETRYNLLKLISSNLPTSSTLDLLQTLITVSTMSYSATGCKDQGFPLDYVPNLDDLMTAREISILFETRHLALQVSCEIVDLLYARVVQRNVIRFHSLWLGDMISLIVKSWTLAFTYALTVLNEKQFVLHSSRNDLDYPLGQAAFFRITGMYLLMAFMWKIARIAAAASKPFNGLTCAGNGSFIRMWETETTYRGFLSHMNKSLNNYSPTANYSGFRCTDYIFSPPEDEDPENPWVGKFELQFPEYIPDDTEMNNHELYHFFVLVLRRVPVPLEFKFQYPTKQVSPYLILNVRRAYHNMTLLRQPFPEPGYNVTIPIMVNGSLTPSSIFWNNLTLTKEPNRTAFHVFKVTTSADREYWQFGLIVSHVFPLKILALADALPEIEELQNTTDVTYELIPRGPYKDHFLTQKLVLPAAGQKTLRWYYLGILLPEALLPGQYQLALEKSYAVCQVLHPEESKLTVCKDVGDSYEYQMDGQVKCTCRHFGLLTITKENARTLEIMSYAHDEHIPIPGRVLAGILFPGVLLVSLIFATTGALLMDRRQSKQKPVKPLNSPYPESEYTIVIGVFTGLHPLAGTCSRIALQIIGSQSTSHVILLVSDKLKSGREFSSDSDVWFVTAVSKPLGEIIGVRIWHDFFCLSDWYCDRILIQDVQHEQWYSAEVHRWFDLMDKDTQFMEVSTGTWLHDLEHEMAVWNQTFEDYYFREFRNSHAPLCLLFLHARNVANYEQKSFKYQAKILSCCFLAWMHQAWLINALPSVYADSDLPYELPNSNVNVNFHLHPSAIWGFLTIALLTRVFILPLDGLYRSVITSTSFRRQTSSPNRSVTPSRRSPRSARSMSPKSDTSSRESRKSNRTKVSSRMRPTVVKIASKNKNADSDERSWRSDPSEHEPSPFKQTSNPRSRRSVSPKYQPSKLRSRKVSPRKSQRSAAHKTEARKENYPCWLLWIVPTHFQSVNADFLILKHRSHSLKIKARCYMAVLSVSTLVLFIYLGVFTDFWRTRTEAMVIYITMALVIDASLLEPVFIFCRAFIGYVFCEMTNTVYHFAWNVDRDLTDLTLEKVSWKEYVKKATTDKHHPLLSSALEKKRRSKRIAQFFLFSLIYSTMFLYGYLLYWERDTNLIASKYAFRIMTIDAESGCNFLGEPSVCIEQIIDDKTAQIWVIKVFAKVIRTWKNGMNISRINSRYWDLSGYSLPQPLTKMITLYQSRDAAGILRPKLIKEMEKMGIEFDERLQGRHYKDSFQETQSLIVNEMEVRYEVLTSLDRITGKSGTSYPLAGHTKEFRLLPGEWPHYYAELRRSMTVIFSSKIITRDRESDLVARAVILLRNSIVPNVIWVAAENVIIEYLPEGICLVLQNIEVNDVIESPTDHTIKTINCILLILLLSLNCYIVCRVGPIRYFTTIFFALKGAFLLICFVSTCIKAVTTSRKIGLVSNITNIAAPHVPFHYIQNVNDLFINILMGVSYLILSFEWIVIIQYIFRFKRMATTFLRCLTMTFIGTIIIVVTVTVITRLSLPRDVRFVAPVFTRMYLKETYYDTERQGNYLVLLLLLAISLAVLNNYFKAIVIYLSERVQDNETVHRVRLSLCGLIKTHQFRYYYTKSPELELEPEPEPEPSSSSALVAPSTKSKLSEKMSEKHTFLTRLLYYPTMN